MPNSVFLRFIFLLGRRWQRSTKQTVPLTIGFIFFQNSSFA